MLALAPLKQERCGISALSCQHQEGLASVSNFQTLGKRIEIWLFRFPGFTCDPLNEERWNVETGMWEQNLIQRGSVGASDFIYHSTEDGRSCPLVELDMHKAGWNGGWITSWSRHQSRTKFPADETQRWDTYVYNLFCCYFPQQNLGAGCLKRILLLIQRWPRYKSCEGQRCLDPFQTDNTMP